MTAMSSETPKPSSEPLNELHHLEAQRRENRERVRGLGLEPYGQSIVGRESTASAKGRHDAMADEAVAAAGKVPPEGFVDPRPIVTIAGRVVLHRDQGKLVWMQVRDDAGDIQVAVSQRDVSSPGFDLAKYTDLGDVVVARGRVMKTRAGR